MNTIKTYLVLLLICLLVLGFTGVSFGQDELFEKDGVRTIKGPKWAPGEIIVKFKRGISEDVIRQINQRHGTSILSISKRGQFMRLRIPSNRTVEEMVSIYIRNPNVEYAEPNFIASALITPNDPYYSYQWHLDNPVYGGIHMESAWDISAGSGVTVAVIDTGIAYEDYQSGRGWWKESYYQAPDLNETCFVEGYDFVNDDTHPNDDNSHGTHVAGTIAQSTNNNKGVAGIAYQSCLMPVKVLDENGAGTYDDVADGIYFAADNGAEVINLSLGGTSPSTTLENAVAYAYNKGVTIVSAAGNEYQWGNFPVYPAAYDDYCIAVGATRYDEKRAYYSNTGSYLDIVAPGGDLTVDQNGDGYGDGVLQNTFNPNSKNTADFGYWFFQGTSMATPHVAGVVALLISDGVTSPDNIRAVLESTAEDLGDLEWDKIYGWGLVDAAAALGYTPDNLPTVSVTAPLDGETVAGTIIIEADATDDIRVVQVDFYYDSTLIGSDIDPPYSVLWDTTGVVDGTYTLTVTTIDTASQSSSDSISVLVDNVNDPPVADAGPDQTVYDSDGNGVESVTLDGSGSYDPDGTITAWKWTEGYTVLGETEVITYDFAVGTHTVNITVTDDGDLTGSDTVTVTIKAPSEEATEVTVDSITYITEGGRYGDKHLLITLNVVDDLSNPVSNASVSINSYLNGSLYASGTSTTDSDGKVIFKLNNAPSGCYKTVVTDITAEGLIWDGVTPDNSFCK